VSSGSIAYSDCCEACLGSVDEYGGSIGHRAATVQGSLRAEVDVAFATCRRGHRLVIRRTARPLVAVLPPVDAAPGTAWSA
jgi:hypothetical protein